MNKKIKIVVGDKNVNFCEIGDNLPLVFIGTNFLVQLKA